MNKSAILLCAAVFAGGIMAHAAIKTETREYKAGDTTMRGVLVYDDSVKEKRPGVVVVPEWWGLNDYAKHRAEMIAQLGYVAFAADMYGNGEVATDAKQASALAGKVRGDRKLMRERAKAAITELGKSEQVDPARIGAIGYCFGGTTVLEMARGGLDVKGVVSFHGGIAPTTDTQTITPMKAKVLVLHGADDPSAPMKDVQALTEELRNAKADYEIDLYGGAVHAFTNPASGNNPNSSVAYNEEADKRSWERMKSFFVELFGGK